MKKYTTHTLKKQKGKSIIKMLTCYDFQTATLLNESAVDLILVGDSLGNVILGHPTTIPVTLSNMILFGSAVKRGAPNKFTIADMPFGTYASEQEGIQNGIRLFQETQCEAIKMEGAGKTLLSITRKLTNNGVPVMGHIGLTPQSIHEIGGFFTQGKNSKSMARLTDEAFALEENGAFAIVLECVSPSLSAQITSKIKIPTIGIGSGQKTDGQVLVINDILHLGKEKPPSFCEPLVNLFEIKKEIIQKQCNLWDQLSP